MNSQTHGCLACLFNPFMTRADCTEQWPLTCTQCKLPSLWKSSDELMTVNSPKHWTIQVAQSGKRVVWRACVPVHVIQCEVFFNLRLHHVVCTGTNRCDDQMKWHFFTLWIHNLPSSGTGEFKHRQMLWSGRNEDCTQRVNTSEFRNLVSSGT